MTIPVRGTVDNASKIAAELDERFTNFYNDLKAWRDRIAANSGTDSWDAAERYQQMTSLRVDVEQRVGAGQTGGISAAYISSYPTHQGGVWNGGPEWAATKAALDPLIVTLRDNWPKKVSVTGEPAYRTFGPGDQLVSFNVPFTGPQKTSILNQINAVLATFTPV